MSERSIIDQLDDAVAALAEGRQSDLKNLGSELSALAGVAQDLIGLPRDAFPICISACPIFPPGSVSRHNSFAPNASR